MSADDRCAKIKSLIRTVPDFPKAGIQFRDVTPLMANPEGLQLVLDVLYERYASQNIGMVVGIDARGFILGGALAYRLGVGFCPARKKGKLPGDCISQSYTLEYGEDALEMQVGSLQPGMRCVVIDDLIATGGTMQAACLLVEKMQGVVVETACVVELPDLKGRQRLGEDRPLFVLCEFEGE